MQVTYRRIRWFDKDLVAITIQLLFLNGARDVAVFACIWIVQWERHIDASNVSVKKHLENSRIFIYAQLSPHNYLTLMQRC